MNDLSFVRYRYPTIIVHSRSCGKRSQISMSGEDCRTKRSHSSLLIPTNVLLIFALLTGIANCLEIQAASAIVDAKRAQGVLPFKECLILAPQERPSRSPFHRDAVEFQI